MIVPLLLLILAILSAGVAAYGTNATWAQYPHGIELILWSRRLEWPLVTVCLILCLAVIALVIAGKRRAWWLIGLGPVLALFVHRFVTDPAGPMAIVENPSFASADASAVADDDYVVGLRFGDLAYAYPYWVLYSNPVVFQSDHEKRMILIWSAFANRAMAQTINRSLKPRDLEVVSMPANALLLYDHSDGQFINGVTGLAMDGQKPAGFSAPIVVSTMTWRQWREINPQTKVMLPVGTPRVVNPPHGPIQPSYPMPPAILDYPLDTRIVLVGTSQPAALPADEVGRDPQYMSVDGETAFVFREAPGKPLRAFSCHLRKPELFTRFQLDREHKYPGATFIDTDTGSGWSAGGAWVDGMKEYRKEFRGTRLTAVAVQDGLYWGVMKFWYPQLKLTRARNVTSES